MLIRFVVDNVYSFGKKREFNMLPNTRLKTLLHHEYEINGFNILKMASIYGANGAGKSNLINSLNLMQDFIVDEIPILIIKNKKFKLEESDKEQTFGIEFFQDGTPFYYALQIKDNFVLKEELYISGLGKKEDEVVYERNTDENGNSTINFFEDFEEDEKAKVLKQVLLEDFVKPEKPILKLLANRDNEYLQTVKKAFSWFNSTLRIIKPNSHPVALAHRIETDSEFQSYAQEIMCSFDIGISSITSEKKSITDIFKNENEEPLDQLIKDVENSPKKMISFSGPRGEEIIIAKEKNEFFAKKLQLFHKNGKGIEIKFDLDDESDGTIRLLDFIPAFKDLVSEKKVYFIDEIERSIHPLLIKELVKKFSSDNASKGQLIFTTHESNLLDQDLFRQDEIWFVEKDKKGCTDIYSLSDFKEHKTIDIRKGYLNGRYNSIPFLGNLENLNWHMHDSKK